MYLASVRGDDKKGLDGVFAEEGVPLMPIAWLHLVISIQTFQRGSGDMNLTVVDTQKHSEEKKNFSPNIWLHN